MNTVTANSDEAQPLFFYDEPQRAQCLNFLLHLAPYSNDLLLVCGEKGSGKTTLIKQFLRKASAAWEVCIVELQPNLSAHTVSEYILAILKASTEIEYDNVVAHNLSSCLGTLQSRGRRPILIFDDAHLLTEETLQLLDHLISSSQVADNGISIILFSENNLPDIPGFAALNRHGSHSFDLPPLQAEEVTLYLRYRLKQAGLSNDRLSVENIKEITKKSNGNLGLIELYSDMYLNGNTTESAVVQPSMLPAIYETKTRLKTSFSIVTSLKWAGGVSIVLLLVFALAFQEEINNSVTTPGNKNPLATTAEKGEMISPVKPSLDQDTAEVTFESLPSQPHQVTIDPLVVETTVIDHVEEEQRLSPILNETSAPPLSPKNKPQTKLAEPLITSTNDINDRPKAELSPHTQIDLPESITANNEIDSLIKSSTEMVVPPEILKAVPSVIVKQDTSENENIPEAELPLQIKSDGAKSVAVDEKADKIIEPMAEIVTTPKVETVKVAAVKHDVAQDNTWLMTRNAKHYTLQLMAMRKEDSVLSQLKKIDDKSRYAIFTTQRKGRSLHILLYGDFTSAKEAALAQQELPAPLRKNKPWIRTFSGMQTELQALNLN
ncbi:MAG: AAA family ATPase [Gammaproteobacteria bacterium]|nr:AAA family ATPase [Gammaproteobacteria bacterium]